jgi:GT2 family glycosyltransferase
MSNPDTPAVSVIVPHYQDLDRLDTCLARLSNQTLARERYEIVVSDNASPVGEASVKAVIAGRARLVVAPEKGAGPTRNVGVAAARGEILAFTDSDCLPEAEWLEAGLRALADFDFVGGRMKVAVEDPQDMTAAEAFEMLFAFDNETYIRDRRFTVTANLFCTRKLFDKVGGFRAGLSEDIEWSQRAVGLGYRIGYAGEAVVWHPARRTWAELERKWARINEEFYELHMSRRFGLARFLAMALSQIPTAAAATPRVLRTPLLGTFGARMDVLKLMYSLKIGRMLTSFSLLLNGKPWTGRQTDQTAAAKPEAGDGAAAHGGPGHG